MLERQSNALEKLGYSIAAPVGEMILIAHQHTPEFFEHIVR